MKLAKNTEMKKDLSTIIYNLAFSPKIRHIDISDIKNSTTEVAEATYKLLKISGAIETLVLNNSGVCPLLTKDFCQALGENKTLKTLLMETSS